MPQIDDIPESDLPELVAKLHGEREAVAGEASIRITFAILVSIQELLGDDAVFGEMLLRRLALAAQNCPAGVAEIVRTAAMGVSNRSGAPLPHAFRPN